MARLGAAKKEVPHSYHRYVVLIATESHARILEVNLGSVTTQLSAERPQLRQRAGREWTRTHYQNHRRDRADRFIKEKIEILDRLMSERGHTHLILAGNPSITARIRGALPRRLAEKLFDVVPAASSSSNTEVVAMTLASFLEQEERESVDAASLVLQELRRNGLAVAGTTASLEALQLGQVDMLVMAEAYDPPSGWVCGSCDWLQASVDCSEACLRCGNFELRRIDVRKEMARLVEVHESAFELVQQSDLLFDLEGVGCLLRYVRHDQRTPSGSR